MKQLLLYSLFITTNLACMLTTDVVSATKDKVYRYWYTKRIVEILPIDVCKQIDCISAQLRNKTIKELLIKTTSDISTSKPKLFISNNGYYFAHTDRYNIHLRDIEKNNIVDTFSKCGIKNPIYLSPHNEYCVIRSGASVGICQTTYFYNLIQKRKHIITPEIHFHCSGITISHDSQHVLYKDDNGGSIPNYTLWTLDTQGKPQEITLRNNHLNGSGAVIFHPDNKHIIHNRYEDELRSYNRETGEDKIISHIKNTDAYCIDRLTLNPDNKKIIAKTRFSDDERYNIHHYIIFNIENLDHVTSVTIPKQSCGTKKQLPVIAIPYKNIITHITNEGRTLELLDENAQLITLHTTKNNTYITALAVDKTGNYLASGYSDGTIMIWHLFKAKPQHDDKIFMNSNGKITSLTFSDNQLLLSQSQAGKLVKGERILCKYGTATLWDMYGNEIINFGNDVVKSIISPNGKTIIILTLINPDYNLTTYHQTDENLAQYSQKELTLAQLSMLINEQNKISA